MTLQKNAMRELDNQSVQSHSNSQARLMPGAIAQNLQRRFPGASVYQLPKRERFNEDFDAKSTGKRSVLTTKSLSVFNKN